MKLLQFNGPWAFSLEDSAVPSPGPNELLVRSDAVGICGSDVHGFTGESGRRKPGMVMGHEVVGTVVAVGREVTAQRVGDLVAVFPTLGCGVCRYCQAGQEHICPDKRILGVNAGRWGAMAEFFTCHSRQAFPVAKLSDPAIGLFAEPLAVALHALHLMNPPKDAILAIVGAGTIGLALTIVLRDLGYRSVFIIDKIPEKLALAEKLGAKAIHADDDPVARLPELAGGRQADGAFEAVGANATVRTAYDLCAFGGTLILIGNLAKEFTLPLQGVTSRETTLRGSYGFNRAEFAEATQLAARNQTALVQFISGSCSLAETPEVMAQLARGQRQATKMVIRPHGGSAAA